MKIQVDLKGKNDLAKVLNSTQRAVGIQEDQQPSIDGFADWIGNVAFSSGLWRNISSKHPDIRPPLIIGGKQAKDHHGNDLVDMGKWFDELIKREPEFATLHLVLSNIGEFRKANPVKFMQTHDSSNWETKIINGNEVLSPKLLDKPIPAEIDNYKTLLEILERKTDPKQRADKVIFTYEVHDGEADDKK